MTSPQGDGTVLIGTLTALDLKYVPHRLFELTRDGHGKAAELMGY